MKKNELINSIHLCNAFSSCWQQLCKVYQKQNVKKSTQTLNPLFEELTGEIKKNNLYKEKIVYYILAQF